MSLGSKELFHTNFWGWLIEQDARFVNVIEERKNLVKRDVCFGLHLEGDQYRISAQKCGADPALESELFSEFKKLGWFQEFGRKLRLVAGASEQNEANIL